MGRVVENSQASTYGKTDKTIQGGGIVKFSTPYDKGGWVAALVKKTKEG